MRGFRRQRRLNPLLVLALADLDQAGVVEPVDRNVAGLGRTHQFHGRGPQRTPVGIGQEILDVLVEVGSLLIIGVGAGNGREHVAGNLAGLDTDVFIAIAVEHLDDIGIVRRSRPRQCAVNASGMLERQSQPCDQIADGKPRAGVQCGNPLGMFERKPRQHRCQSVDHARPQAPEGFRIARLDVHLEPDYRLQRMNVRTDIDRNGIDIQWGILIKRRVSAHENAVRQSRATQWSIVQHAERSSAEPEHHEEPGSLWVRGEGDRPTPATRPDRGRVLARWSPPGESGAQCGGIPALPLAGRYSGYCGIWIDNADQTCSLVFARKSRHRGPRAFLCIACASLAIGMAAADFIAGTAGPAARLNWVSPRTIPFDCFN